LARAAVEILKRYPVSVEIHELQGVANDQVPLWINASDVLLLTSLHEGSPTIVKESLACDVPVVSVDVGDVRERIQRIDGCYLALADPSDLASKLNLVYNSLRRVKGRVHMQELSLERTALRLKQFYDEILRIWGNEKPFTVCP
jgi:glycosyltransferase involved in cell wall biosynthesis